MADYAGGAGGSTSTLVRTPVGEKWNTSAKVATFAQARQTRMSNAAAIVMLPNDLGTCAHDRLSAEA